MNDGLLCVVSAVNAMSVNPSDAQSSKPVSKRRRCRRFMGRHSKKMQTGPHPQDECGPATFHPATTYPTNTPPVNVASNGVTANTSTFAAVTTRTRLATPGPVPATMSDEPLPSRS